MANLSLDKALRQIRITLLRLFAFFGFIFLPVAITIILNTHTRHTIIETWAHWGSKIVSLEAVIVGDSMAPGGAVLVFPLCAQKNLLGMVSYFTR